MKRIILLLLFQSLIFSVFTDASAQVSPPRNAVYDKQHIMDKTPVEFPYIREADVIWVKRIWRVIDLRERFNQPLYFPEVPTKENRNLITVIMDALREGTIEAYDASGLTDDFLVPQTYQEIENRLNKADTMRMQRPDPPYDFYDTVISKVFNPMDVKLFRLKEDWVFDKQRSVFEARIIGLCPVVDSYAPDGEWRGHDPLFWINFDDARKVFAQAEVFNPRNNGARLSYDDLFLKRMFTSYIYKEDNVSDSKISDYATGLDALLEAERIKEEMFRFESDIWEY
ncbi:MAG: gliding motility protein GldN [Bacteroidales bacterium]|jgi:gliding motility associated protien GldN|nr:gliding motility protein GldN [Bacteroidales bacterium]